MNQTEETKMAIEDLDMETKYPSIMINGKNYLYNSIRLSRASIPKNLPIYIYSVRSSDDDGGLELASIHGHVFVNHDIDIISLEPLEFSEENQFGIIIDDYSFTDEHMTVQEFIIQK